MVNRQRLFRAGLSLSLLALLLCSGGQAIAQPDPAPTLTAPSTELPIVGLNRGNRTVNPGVFVRGEIDELTAVNLADWLLPYEAVLAALQFTTTVISDAEIELRSPYKILRLNPNDIRQDPELGRVLSVQEIRDRFGIGVEFDGFDYAIVFDVPELGRTGQGNREPLPVILDGLPRVNAPAFSFSVAEQEMTLTTDRETDWRNRGQLAAVGTFFGSSWFAKITQGNLFDRDPWQLSEFQVIRQRDRSDYYLGSQPTFWRDQTPGDFWGFTTIQRQGYAPFPYRHISGGANPDQRLQPEQITATISGRAAPGTVVQLVTDLRQRDVLAEELVDGSGVYRFNDVAVGRGVQRNYYVLLFPDGSLTAEPTIEEARFTLLPEQLPTGASALVASGGWRRDRQPGDFFGELQDFSGGLAYRQGLSPDLTLGVGGVYDDGWHGLAELFLQPKQTPLRLAVSGLMSRDLDVDAEMVWDDEDLYITLNTDLERTRYTLNWRVLPNIRFSSRGTWDDFARFGLQYSQSSRQASTILGVNWQTNDQWDWRWYQRWSDLTLIHTGDDRPGLSKTATELSYRLNPSEFLNLELETRSAATKSHLLTTGWEYRSQDRNSIGQSLWQAELGYGVGSEGHGPYLLLGTTVIPGLFLEARYDTVALQANRNRFSLQLRSSLGLQGSIGPGDRRPERLRTQGGLWLQPFYDFNGNGQRDGDDRIYRESNDFLIVNNEVVRGNQIEQEGDRLLLPLPPGRHRIDLEEAGFPPDFQPLFNSVAVEVIEGSYTPVAIPLQASYTLMGVITNADGEPVAGARVEAVNADDEVISFSITNSAGVYYLEQLRLGRYQIKINGQTTSGPNSILFDPESDTLEELNLQSQSRWDFPGDTIRARVVKPRKVPFVPLTQNGLLLPSYPGHGNIQTQIIKPHKIPVIPVTRQDDPTIPAWH
ncbi:carboxypeptidase-like regulatory domain-containing protein [Spirulina major CS-329]|uniref:carboxypeptidase-like regulatory domain-containing protein n=1 Tax=Spirulina TaxID=1154 RepID=UPI00232C9B38|nr:MULTISPECIES: carboxypeptidase-like regulatory domain-containing protein [Spirulina]MDB9495042.1 carboxypeptidase-like regulatory domain-containing protein [Spirulina subsalsa CS-330]MDB9502948.1 carboxypeptidase-like regulatory domain-containing protein [Spirulina major CS-329]